MLISLAYRVPRENLDALLGTITAYPLSEPFSAAWETLPRTEGQWRQPYKTLETGLVAATGQPVELFKMADPAGGGLAPREPMLLLTSASALDHRLRIAVRAWERHVRKGAGTSVLADLLPAPDPARSFADYVEFRPGTVPAAPKWVFRTASRQILRQLAREPLQSDGRSLALRMDTSGSLLAWELGDLIVNSDPLAFGMATVRARLVTVAGVEDMVVCFDASLSRISPQGYRAKNAWIEREDKESLILRLPVKRYLDQATDTWRTRLDPVIAAILEACQLEPLEIPAELPKEPGAIRPQMAESPVHFLGSGLGPRFMLRLHEHILRTLPLLVPLDYQIDKSIRLLERVKQYPDGGLPGDAVGPSGYDRITLVCAYDTADARDRMFAELEEMAGRPVRPEAGGAPVGVNERLDVVARHCPDLLDHATANRAAFLDGVRVASASDSHLVVAWLETEFHPTAERPELDAKPHLRRLLGHLGIPAQFTATEPVVLPPKAKSRGPAEKKHAARAALRDLLRAAGVLDDRLLHALTHKGLANRLDRRVLLVGVHLREQQTGASGSLLVTTMVALFVDPHDLASWRTLMFSENRDDWVRVAEGIAEFHSGAIGTSRMGRSPRKAERTRAEIERRLDDLASGEFAGIPLVVFVDAPATRLLWTGLQNGRLGDGPLPGDAVHVRGGDVAVVRLNTDLTEIGRPVTRREKANMPGDPRQPAAPDRKVYRLTDSVRPSWLFPGRSATLKAKGGNSGARFTRWTLPADSRELGRPWHSYTAKEIVVVRAGSWTAEALAALTARLCEQPVSWDDRTMLPVPLHLAAAIGRDHPDWRVRHADENGN
ncbi:hypothetical protein BTM25_02830 [Actinomadura rubteroloni]|uniref:DUF3893 domain-containing protein n=1 Tax=Actinomadura rubteroloni TaxID=1926885 RepID=A0A2P4ULM3_9ACTN|nr:RNaseH domain-containing protein [Actinomadura rubteroloni]POM25899.1 hypothetical protein BTM25_02830 [Actinomadura rubteroloni]